MLKNILAITGKPGLYKLVQRGNNHLIVESLLDGKRTPTFARDKIISVADVAMYTTGEDKPLNEILTAIGEKEGKKVCSLDVKKADNEQLRAYFAEILPDFDRDRVYPTDIRKLLQWYNILVNAGITDFTIEEEEGEAPVAAPVAEKQEKQVNTKQAVKTQKSAAVKSRTNVGTKKG